MAKKQKHREPNHKFKTLNAQGHLKARGMLHKAAVVNMISLLHTIREALIVSWKVLALLNSISTCTGVKSNGGRTSLSLLWTQTQERPLPSHAADPATTSAVTKWKHLRYNTQWYVSKLHSKKFKQLKIIVIA